MTLTKFLESQNFITIVFIRVLCGFLIIMPFIFRGVKHKQPLKTSHPWTHGFYAFATGLSMLCTYYAYMNLPLAFATAIGFTSPLVTTVLAIIFLKEKVTVGRWLVLAFGYVGVLILIHPSNAPFSWAIVVALVANLAASCATITLKNLSRTENNLQILLYSNSMMILFIGGIVLFAWSDLSRSDFFLVACLGAIATFAQYCFIRGMRLGMASVVAPFQYTRLVFSIPFGVVLFHETISFQTLMGACFIIGANLYLLAQEASP